MKKRAMPGAFRSIARFDEWLGRKDSNPRMPESKSGALTNLATPQRKPVPLSLRVAAKSLPPTSFRRIRKADGARACVRPDPQCLSEVARARIRRRIGTRRPQWRTPPNRSCAPTPRLGAARQLRTRSREISWPRRLRDHSARNRRKRRLFSSTRSSVSIQGPRKSTPSTPEQRAPPCLLYTSPSPRDS